MVLTTPYMGYVDEGLITLFSLPAISLAKQSINAAVRPQRSDLLADADRFFTNYE